MTGPGSEVDEALARKTANLRAILAGPPARVARAGATTTVAARPDGAEPRKHTRRNALTAIGLALAFVAGKLKFLGILAGVLKLQTLATMALAVGIYAVDWGWPFAAGFVLLLFLHELGHAIVL